jgi:hypothetical protein
MGVFRIAAQFSPVEAVALMMEATGISETSVNL